MKKELVFWLAEKLGVDLEAHFYEKLIPDEEEEWTRMTEEEFDLHTMSSVQRFVSQWLTDSRAKKDDVKLFAADLLEDFEIGDVEGLEDIAQELELEDELEDRYDTDPVEHIYELEDEQGRLYLWKLPDEWSEQQRDNLFARLVSTFREKYNRDPKAAHLLLTEVEKVQEVDRDEMKDLLGHAANDLG